MNVISLFSGAGGMDHGFQEAGHDIVMAIDNSVNACTTYEQNLDIKPICKDIRKVHQYPQADMIVACCPCQGFSMFGTRKYNDARNFLYKEIVRYLKKVKPKYFITENVKGLLSLYKRDFFNLMINDFNNAGYRLRWKLINAKHYGVPQDRLRVFIAGVRKDITFNFSFPVETHGNIDKSEDILILSNDESVRLEYSLNRCDKKMKKIVTLKNTISNMSPPQLGEFWNSTDYSFFYMSRNRRRSWDEVSYTIQASGRHTPLHPSCPPMIKIGKDEWTFTDEISKYRRLSYRECARIQTFPDKYEFVGSVDSKYRQIGNAVTPLYAYKLGKAFNKISSK